MNKLFPISVGILSYKAYKTLDNTLNQYGSFLKNFEESKIFFQTFCDIDKKIAEKYDVNYEYRENNVGIQDGIKWVVENLKNDYVLYLENDFLLLYDIEKSLNIIERSLNLLRDDKIDIMRLRSRFIAGDPFEDVVKYTKIFKPECLHPEFKDFHKIHKASSIMKYIRPFKAKKISARSIYIEKYPEKICKQIKKYDDNSYIVDSSVLNWTNNPILISKKLFLELLDYADKHPSSRTVNTMQDLEKPLNCRWWRKQHFKIGVCDGIFTHSRLDR